MTDEKVKQKFRHNCEGLLSRANIDRIVHEVMNLGKGVISVSVQIAALEESG